MGAVGDSRLTISYSEALSKNGVGLFFEQPMSLKQLKIDPFLFFLRGSFLLSVDGLARSG